MDYHVSKTGKENGNGSITKPFDNIQKAISIVKPGETIYIHEGIYREELILESGGNNFEEQITIKNFLNDNVTIKGSEVIKDWEQLRNGLWVKEIDDSFFGNYNPFKVELNGDWFEKIFETDNLHAGMIFQNNSPVLELFNLEDVLFKKNSWFVENKENRIIIYANFEFEPNNSVIEITTRETIISAKNNYTNYIWIEGLNLQHAATKWAPPTREQKGLISIVWSYGWTVKNCNITDSKCVGISLGKYDDGNNGDTDSAIGYVGTINRAIDYGWTNETVGCHKIINNKISRCEQGAIAGSMGCINSKIINNEICDIYINKQFKGAEMAAIKFHIPLNVEIIDNRIINSPIGIWLDWGAENTSVTNNYFEKNDWDFFVEVSHGPTYLKDNIFKSAKSIAINANNVIIDSNIISGDIVKVEYDNRQTPAFLKGDTKIEYFGDLKSGNVVFKNNVFLPNSNYRAYLQTILPTYFSNNVFYEYIGEIKTDSLIQVGETSDEFINTMKSIGLNEAIMHNNYELIKDNEENKIAKFIKR